MLTPPPLAATPNIFLTSKGLSSPFSVMCLNWGMRPHAYGAMPVGPA